MKPLNKTFWEERYKIGQTGWDLGTSSPPLTAYINQLEVKNLKILIPGAGFGHEALYLNKNGFTNVTVIDIAATPLKLLEEKLPKDSGFELVESDFFQHSGKYDLILEQTFFCALQPEMRLAYAKKMNGMLRPGGKLVGVLFDFKLTEEGPPFAGNQKEYLNIFGSHFKIKTLERCTNSIKPRQGNELFFIFEKP